jgi:phosphatidylethanolamine/phosphatidyl-N-methylethanolamine N-methyltransferase
VHDLQFFKSFLARPRTVASPIPSGRTLAAKIASQIDPEPGGMVLELGPGTGAVTRAICERVAEQDLIAIENDAGFVALLRAQFSRARIVEGDGFAFADVLGESARGLRSIVSGLPVIGRSLELRRRFLESAMRALQKGKPFVQFSYSGRAPFPCIDGVTAQRAAIVWQNILPMHIWVYRRSDTKLRNNAE